jgi:toxin ParE1/3/4
VTKVVWAPQAIDDVEAIRAHVARDSTHYADLVVERIVAAVSRLEHHPRSGRVVPEVGDQNLREIIHGNYRIVYRLAPAAVEIATVFHGARLFRLD